jgi:glycosyltransferase involved in cell wall biosynthesis
MRKEALVSIIMPTFNREKLLPRAINSVIDQTYNNWELIVIDDRSTDNTKELIQEHSEKDKRIRYIKNTHKKGPGGARNTGIEAAKGKYLAFLDSDDEWFKYHLKNSVKVLQNEQVKICVSNWYRRINKKLVEAKLLGFKESINDLKPKVKKNLIFFDERFYEYSILNDPVWFYHLNGAVFEKSILKNVRLMNEKLITSEDVEFLTRIFFNFNFCFINNSHFIWNEGRDNLYFFRGKENKRDSELIDKLCFIYKNEIKQRKIRKKFIKNNRRIKNPNLCILALNKKIEEFYHGIAYNYKKHNKIKSIYYYLLKFYYNFKSEEFSLFDLRKIISRKSIIKLKSFLK